MAQQQVQKSKQTTTQAPAAEIDAPPEHTDTQKLTASTADILDEIDLVLEENAEEFVQGYIQKGGQ